MSCAQGQGVWLHIYSVGVFRGIYTPITRPAVLPSSRARRRAVVQSCALALSPKAFDARRWSFGVVVVDRSSRCTDEGRGVDGCATGWRQTRDVCVCVRASERARGGGRCEDDAHR